MPSISSIVGTFGTALVASITAVGTVYARLVQHDRDNDRRISVLEAHRADDMDRLAHIQVQVDKLVDWHMEGR